MPNLNLPTPNKSPGDGAPADDINLVIDAVNTLNSAVDNIPAGPQGPQGEPGTPGAAGANASVSIGSVNTGAPGSSAAVTNSGTAQNAVFNFTIPQGATGAAGAAGAQGPQGPKGDDGDNAAISVGTVATGAPGSSATVINSGTTTNAVLNFSIPRGDKGDKGDTGATGPQGPQGDAATIAVGTVTTGPEGSSAVITNVGTSGSAVFDFTIPRGDTGPAANLGSNSPQNLGVAAAGTSALAAREDHVHNMPSAADVGADSSGSAAAAQSAAESYADSLAVNYDPAGAASSAVSSHNADTTGVHGISNTTDLVYTTDARLSDARTPTAHATSHEFGGSDALELAPSQITGTAVVDSDSRLTDTRTPTDGTVTDAKITAGGLSPTAITGTAVVTNDSRLSDARTPLAHAASHGVGQSDAITVAQSQVTNLTTDLSAKAPLASPALSGTPTAPTAAVGTDTTQIATTAFVNAEISNDAILKSIVDAKGDIIAATADNTVARVAVGTDGQALIADSTQTSGVRWGTVATDPTPTALFLGGM